MKKIKGMDKLSLNIPIKIKLLSSETFLIVDTRKYKNYISGGIDKESFIPIKKKFLIFIESLNNPYNKDLLG